MTCRVCGRRLRRPATGRPPVYCSPACRRAAELRVQRAQRRLERLEDRIGREREAASGGLQILGSTPATLTELERQHDELEGELRQTLADLEGAS